MIDLLTEVVAAVWEGQEDVEHLHHVIAHHGEVAKLQAKKAYSQAVAAVVVNTVKIRLVVAA